MRCRGIALAAEAGREPEVDAPEVDAEERSEADGGGTKRTVGAGDTGDRSICVKGKEGGNQETYIEGRKSISARGFGECCF